MDGNNALYKIEYQLLMNKVQNRIDYEDALAIWGAGHDITVVHKQQLADAEEAEKLFDELRVKLLLEGGKADE